MKNLTRYDQWRMVLQEEADARHEAHKDHASSRPFSEDYELVGLVGEAKFGVVCNQMPDLERKLDGDGGIDFVVPLKFSVDVKTFRKPYHLLVESGKVAADIYVLAGYDDDTKKATLLGWEWGAIIKRTPVKEFNGNGVINHYIHASKLRPMIELTKRM